MARSPRLSNAPTTVSTPTTRSVPTTRNRARPSTVSTPAVSTPTPAAAPPTPVATPDNSASSSKLPRTSVEAKTHGLRSVGEKERSACPYPGEYGGSAKCGVTEEDEKDEVLMAIGAACAKLDNRALSPDEIAMIAFDEGWLRPPSAAIAPATVINNAIRSHQKRCSLVNPPRPCLLNKHQLAGSVNESVLESALHPNAFNGLTRPKGTVWYLAQVGKAKWKNPFSGIEIPKAPPRKPGPPKRVKDIKPKPKEKDVKSENKGKTKIAPAPAVPLKIKLVVNNQPAAQDEEEEVVSDAPSSSKGSRGSRQTTSRSQSVTPAPQSSTPITIDRRQPARKIRSVFDSSDESDTSDSDVEMAAGPSRIVRPIKIRKDRPPPLPLPGNNPSRSHIPPHLSRSLGSPFIDWGHGVPTSPNMPPPQLSSPFPSHSLDNTTWAARHDTDQMAGFETSSSSSDDEMRDSVDWGTVSGIMIRSAEDGDDMKPMWSMEDEEAKIKEATDALRVLFPMSAADEEVESEDQTYLNRLDNRPTPSDTSSVAESASTAIAPRGPLKSADVAGSLALSAWNGNSSPVSSPNMRNSAMRLPIPDASPTQHLSKLNHSFDADDMEVDADPWRGELPVQADDSFSDIELDGDLTSNIGDMPTPEHDRQLDTAVWAAEAAASVSYRVKEEAADYPSPMTTESDDVGADYRNSRAGSSESQTPSSGLSDLPPDYEADSERMLQSDDLDETLVGPESISVEELDGWLPGLGKTPQRHKSQRGRPTVSRSDSKSQGSWCGIGVGTPAPPNSPIIAKQTTKVTPVSQPRRTSRTRMRRRTSSARAPVHLVGNLPTPPAEVQPLPIIDLTEPPMASDLDFDAIGPDDFEAACAEAEQREEKHRKACREKAERTKAFLEACHEKVREGQFFGRSPDISPPVGWSQPSPWCDTPACAWSSTDSYSVQTPSALSPMALHMSSLSLDSNWGNSMDPKALISPPLLPSAMSMMEELLHRSDHGASVVPQRDVAIVPIHSYPASYPPRPISVEHTPMGIEPFRSVQQQKASMPPSPARPQPTAAQAPIEHKPSTTHTKPVPIVPKPEKPAERSIPQIQLPKTIPPAWQGVVPSTKSASKVSTLAPAPAPSSAPATSPSAPVPRVLTPIAPAEAPKKPLTPAPQPSGASNTMPPPRAPVTASNSSPIITKPLCAGVDACVVDNIPVYSHVCEVAGLKHNVLRRLDTDFVNGTVLCSALGMSTKEIVETLNKESPWLGVHCRVGTHCESGLPFSAGVPGTWIPFAEAKELDKRLKNPPNNLFPNVLRDDLFSLFAQLASIEPKHAPGETFGLPFTRCKEVLRAPPNSANSSNSSLSASSANSKSAPNLPALSASAPPAQVARASAGQAKGPLVRSAPPTPPDGCPQPKRRRATMSLAGDISPLAKISPPGSVASPNIAPAVGANGRKPIARATRASIAGDTPKPRLVK